MFLLTGLATLALGLTGWALWLLRRNRNLSALLALARQPRLPASMTPGT